LTITTATTNSSFVDLFIESIKSPATRVTYKQSLNQFREATGFKLTDKGKTKGKVLQKKIIEYVIQLKKNGASYSRINVIVSAMQAYCDAYDIDVNFDKVRRYMPEHVRKVKDRAYTKEEIRTLLDAANTRVRMLILLFVSTGMREGAVPALRLKHMTKMQDGCYKISLYDEDVSKQITVFTTRECSQALQAPGSIFLPSNLAIQRNLPNFFSSETKQQRCKRISSCNSMFVHSGSIKKNWKEERRKNSYLSVCICPYVHYYENHRC
jgi:integrase